MDIIDMRCRPPFGNFNNDWFFGGLKLSEESCGHEMAPSAWQRSMALFLEEMDKAHITKAVVTGRYAFPGVPVEKLTIDNGELCQLVNDYPGRFIGVISIDATNCDLAITELDRYVNAGPCSGLTLETQAGKAILPFDSPLLYPIYDKCQKDNIFIILCSGFVYPSLEMADPKTIDHVARDFPELHIMLSHGGWPYVNECCFLAFKHKNLFLSPDSFMINRPGSADYISAANYLLQDKICFGTAYPFLDMSDAVNNARVTIRSQVLPKYLYNNAASFLQIH